MTARTLVLALAAMQAAFVAADFADRRLAREHDGERLQAEGAAFLVAVAVSFLVVQYGGLALAPTADALIERVRAAVAGAAPGATRPLPAWAVPLAAVALFYVAGFWDYVWHRGFSHSRWFWPTHEYHHLPNQVFAAMPGLLARPFAVLVTVPVLVLTAASAYAACALAGFAPPGWAVFQPALVAGATVLTASHSSCLRRSWRVHRVLRRLAVTTPQEHLLHHTVDLAGNYGNFTSVWDRLFGTYLDPERAEYRAPRLGLGYDQDFLGTLTFGLVKLPARARRRFGVGRYCNLDP